MTPKFKINTGVFVVLCVVFCLFFIGKSGLYLLSGLRAYVNAEALWSKSQKEAAYQLAQYVFTQDESKYQAFIDNLKVPLGDKKARLELQKSKPVDAIAFNGFAEGGNHPDDISKMIFLFKYSQGLGYIREAIKQWEIADLHIEKFLEVGIEAHDFIINSRMTSEHSARILSSIDALQKGVTSAEVLFSDNMSEATRWISKFIFTIMIIFTVVGSFVCFIIIHLIAGIGKKLIKSEQRYRRLTENAPDMIYRMSLPDGKYEYVSPAAEKIYGYNPQEFYDTPVLIKNVIHPDWQNYFAQQWSLLLSGNMPPFYEYQIIDKFGETRWLHQRNVLIKSDNGKPIAIEGIVTDITDRKKSEEEKANLESQLLQAHKMEAVGTLAGGIAHDFNNILSVILGYTELAKEDSPPGFALGKDLDQVLDAGNRAKDLVKQILAFSRQAKTERIPLQLQSLIKEAIKMLRASIPTTIDIQDNINSDCGVVLADPTHLHQIIMNLCTNANHAMEETGGVLKIELQNTLIESTNKQETNLVSGQYVQLSISDTGPGIGPDIIDKIFDPYFTTKEVGKGTGMGLAIIHGIIVEYGGAITVESKLGKGTTFHLYFPVVEQEMLEPDSEEDIPSGSGRILFIDDEEILAQMGKDMLERLGYHVTTRSSSLDALTTFQNAPDSFNVVITDQTMPGMTGSDLARRMLQIRPDIPIILCTGYSTLIDEHSAKVIGIRKFALKPLTKATIAKLLHELLGRS